MPVEDDDKDALLKELGHTPSVFEEFSTANKAADPESQLRRAYTQFTGREADDAGLAAHLKNPGGVQGGLNAIYASPESQAFGRSNPNAWAGLAPSPADIAAGRATDPTVQKSTAPKTISDSALGSALTQAGTRPAAQPKAAAPINGAPIAVGGVVDGAAAGGAASSAQGGVDGATSRPGGVSPVTASTFQGFQPKYAMEGFDTQREQNTGKSAKDAFAYLANQAPPPPLNDKAALAGWFNQYIKPGMDQLGHTITNVEGDKFGFKNWQGEFNVDYGRGAGAEGGALAWQVDDPSAKLSNGAYTPAAAAANPALSAAISGDTGDKSAQARIRAEIEALMAGAASPTENEALLAQLQA